MTPSIEELRAWLDDDVHPSKVWKWAHEVLTAHVRATITRRYSPRIYSPSGEWDIEGVEDLVHDFLLEKCVLGNALAAAIRCETATDAARLLETALRYFMIDRAPRSIRGNLHRRLSKEVLPGHTALAIYGQTKTRHYGLASWEGHPPHEMFTVRDVQRAGKFIPADVRRVEYATGGRLSPVISSDDLGRIAVAVIGGCSRLMTAADLVRVIEVKFDLAEPVIERLDQVLPEVAAPTQDDDEDYQEAAKRFLRALPPRHVQYLILRLDGRTSLEVAERLGVHRNSVTNYRRSIEAQLAQWPTAEERRGILRVVSNQLQQGVVHDSALASLDG